MAYCRGPAGFDRTRNAVIGNKNFDLTYLEEAYTSEHWLVRIYRVKKPHEFNRPIIKSDDRIIQSEDYISKKVYQFGFNLISTTKFVLRTLLHFADYETKERCP